ncbi:hypothetical protein [Bacillus wiedmannii]|uniref:hypothetical protein n=1 Tax=Bacillus wiedmannii TaxID=1890302 RepID=UPI002E22780B|nr:hypothetical protein [Bacillus wiedmannii]
MKKIEEPEDLIFEFQRNHGTITTLLTDLVKHTDDAMIEINNMHRLIEGNNLK